MKHKATLLQAIQSNFFIVLNNGYKVADCKERNGVDAISNLCKNVKRVLTSDSRADAIKYIKKKRSII